MYCSRIVYWLLYEIFLKCSMKNVKWWNVSCVQTYRSLQYLYIYIFASFEPCVPVRFTRRWCRVRRKRIGMTLQLPCGGRGFFPWQSNNPTTLKRVYYVMCKIDSIYPIIGIARLTWCYLICWTLRRVYYVVCNIDIIESIGSMVRIT